MGIQSHVVLSRANLKQVFIKTHLEVVFNTNLLGLQICSYWAALFTKLGIAIAMID